jgi:2-oxoglutarate ferredoxin oxidoreductase subunit alpha
MKNDFNVMVGGEAGQGVQSTGILIAKGFSRGGYHVFADQDYESRVRGGHNFFRIRIDIRHIGAFSELVDVLIALNRETIELHQKEMLGKGIIIYDGEQLKDVSAPGLFHVPMERLAEEHAGNKIMSNTVSLGALLALVDYDFEILAILLKDYFSKEATGENNIKAAKAGYDYAKAQFKGDPLRTLKPLSETKRMLLNGNDAVSLGAIAAGCKFMSAYPMTPATPIMEYIAEKAQELDMVMVHAEDEISAINMAIGASYSGARAMTATSGSGFCLMVEGLGMAGITETPLVIINSQRPGPAVGLPTRTEQGDLQFVLTAHHGDFPRVVLAPTTAEDAFWLTVKAFNLADKYQLPVIILTDHCLTTSYTTVETFDISQVTIDRGLLLNSSAKEDYLRHEVTLSGISPRALPGAGKALVVTDADEHDESGHLTEDAKVRTEQMQKRLRKMFELKQEEMSTPRYHGKKNPDALLIGWGSTYGAIREAVDILQKQNESFGFLHLTELQPFPAEAVAEVLRQARTSYVIENNASGQLARLIRAETGIEPGNRILKFDGRPFSPSEIADDILQKEGY